MWGSTSGLTRRAARARLPVWPASSISALSSCSDSTLLQGAADLLVGLSDAGEDGCGRVGAGFEDPAQLAAADHVEPGPALPQEAQHVQVLAALDRKADRRSQGSEGFGKSVIVIEQGPTGIDVGRRAETPGQFGQGDVFAVQHAIAILEVIHSPGW